jgi:hypothetical protein
MGESILVRKGGGVELTGNAATGDVLSGQTFYSNNASSKLTGTLALTGNAIASEVFSGKTFYSTNAKTRLTGTFVFDGNATVANVQTGRTFFATNGTKLTGTGIIAGNYSTWVVQNKNGAKYQIHNGYDKLTNPTPNLANLPFNQWLLNNSASGTPVLTNTILTNAGSFNGPGTVDNSLSKINSAASNIFNYRFIAAGSNLYGPSLSSGNTFVMYNAQTYTLIASRGPLTDSVQRMQLSLDGGNIVTLSTLTSGAYRLGKFFVSNIFYANAAATLDEAYGMAVSNDNYTYVSGYNGTQWIVTRHISSSHSQSAYGFPGFGEYISNIVVNDAANRLYVIGPSKIRAYARSGTSLLTERTSIGGDSFSSAINDGKLYLTGTRLRVYWENNLALIANSSTYPGGVSSTTITFNNNYIYVGLPSSDTIYVYHQNNLQLAYIKNVGSVFGLQYFNNSIYSGLNAQRLTLYPTISTSDLISIYQITNVEE